VLGAVGAVGIMLVVHGYGEGVAGASGPTGIVNSAPLRVSPQGTAPLVGIDVRTGTTPATSGFDVQVVPGATTVTVGVSTAATSRAQTGTYASGDRVFFVETTFGDDSWNLGAHQADTEGREATVA
jgi:hypothetical protein